MGSSWRSYSLTSSAAPPPPHTHPHGHEHANQRQKNGFKKRWFHRGARIPSLVARLRRHPPTHPTPTHTPTPHRHANFVRLGSFRRLLPPFGPGMNFGFCLILVLFLVHPTTTTTPPTPTHPRHPKWPIWRRSGLFFPRFAPGSTLVFTAFWSFF